MQTELCVITCKTGRWAWEVRFLLEDVPSAALCQDFYVVFYALFYLLVRLLEFPQRDEGGGDKTAPPVQFTLQVNLPTVCYAYKLLP